MPPPVIRNRYEDVNFKQIRKFEIVHEGVFSLKTFLFVLREYLIANDYAVRPDERFPEIFFLQRNTKAGKFIQMHWYLEKEGDDTKLWIYGLDIQIDARMLKEVEFMHQGKKVKANNGELNLKITTRVIEDKEQAIKGHKWFGKHEKYLRRGKFRKQLEGHVVELAGDSDRLQSFIKEHLGMEYYQDDQLAEFWPKKPGP